MASRSDPSGEFHTYCSGTAANIRHRGPCQHACKHPSVRFSLDSSLGHHSIPCDLDITDRKRVIGHFLHPLTEPCVKMILEDGAYQGIRKRIPSTEPARLS